MATGTGFKHVTAYLCAKDAAGAIDFYKNAFGARELFRMDEPDGRLGHAEITIGDTLLMLADEWPEFNVLAPSTLNGNSVSFMIEVDDADAAFKQAVGTGAAVERGVVDEPYGRRGTVVDPYCHRWTLITSNPDFKPEDMN